MINPLKTRSSYLDFLPAIYRSPLHEDPSFFERYLKIFEKILHGIDDDIDLYRTNKPGIAETLADIARYFNPQSTPYEFVDWLAGWVGLTFKQDWSLSKKREVIAKIIPLYRMRGTKRGLEEYLRIYVGEGATVYITELIEPFQINVTSTIGRDTVLKGRPYYFQVHMTLLEPSRDLLIKKRNALLEIIEKEKPAHTRFSLIITVPTMQINVHSTVGKDTLLGGITTE